VEYAGSGTAPAMMWLRNAPRLMAGYLTWLNRRRDHPRRHLLLAFALITAWAIIAALLFAALRPATAEALAWMHRHQFLLGGLAACMTAALVARRHAGQRSEAARSWLAALPVRRATARWEALAIAAAPALGAICIVAAAGGTAWIAALYASDPAPAALASTWIAVTTGVIVGAMAGYLVPVPKAAEVPPGSRYVPHPRVLGARHPVPSLYALGRWPIRQMFASARPKAVTRAVLPILLMIPLGSTAAAAMLVIAMSAVLGALLLLVSAIIRVSRESGRWLQPLPLPRALLARRVLVRPLAVIWAAALIAAWLLWVMGSPPTEALQYGFSLLVLSSSVAVVGSAAAISRTRAGRR
jgi:hypothetical protein